MTVVITGGAGVIGAPLARRLVERGERPVLWDVRDDRSLLAGLEGQVEFVQRGLDDVDSMAAALQSSGCRAVAHLAALVSFPAIDANLHGAFAVNAMGAVNVLEAARLAKVPRVVMASSKAVYGHVGGEHGRPRFLPLTEDHPLHPVNVYDGCKVAAEVMGRAYRRVHGLDFTALRFATIYGPGKGSRHGYSSLFTRLVEHAIAGEPLVVEKGADQIDDLVYVEDVVSGLLAALDAPAALPSPAYHIGGGRPVSVREFVEALRGAVPGAQLEVGGGDNYLSETVSYRSVLSVSRAARELGFRPAYDLPAGVRDYVERVRSAST